ncbi:MAG TPA: hypothetical protein VK468_08350 [Pyrinomonadaceae bacterium]|nr:hypothetical protein [Pyrinomonadaceae bacterium]
MELHQIQKTVLPNGTIVIEDLPFEAGEMVNVTIVKSAKMDPKDPYPLRGTSYSYEDPFSPLIAPEDWKPFK